MQENSNGSNVLAILTAAEQKLAECTEVGEVLQLRDQAEMVRTYMQRQRASLKLQNQAARVKILAERQIGRALAAMKLRGGDRKSKSTRSTLIFRLEDVGISKDQSAQWQQEAAMTSEQFEAYCRRVEEEEQELSSKGLCRYIQSTHRRPQRKQSRRQTNSAAIDGLSQHSAVEEMFSEMRGHLQSLERMFATICARLSSDLNRIEEREIPRYLRELLLLVDEIEDWRKQESRRNDPPTQGS